MQKMFRYIGAFSTLFNSSQFPSFDLGSTTSAMLFTKSLVRLFPGVTSARQKNRLEQGKEHIKNTKQCAKRSNVAKHAF